MDMWRMDKKKSILATLELVSYTDVPESTVVISRECSLPFLFEKVFGLNKSNSMHVEITYNNKEIKIRRI